MVWTVDTWRIKPGRESHFLQNCSALSPKALVVYRDLDDQNLFWSPAKWESREALDAWRGGNAYRSALAILNEDASDHVTHLMQDVPGFSPQTPSPTLPTRGRERGSRGEGP
jgi:heme-degrading monooxygenase HmoA